MKKVLEFLIANMGNVKFLLVGLTSTIKGSVKKSGSGKDGDSKTFNLIIDWSECTFGYLVNLACQSIRIQEQAKMREVWDELPEISDWNCSVSKKETRSVSKHHLEKLFEKMSAEDQVAFAKTIAGLKKA